MNSKKDLGGGTVLDLGIYTIQVCQWVFQQTPKSIKATGKLNDDGVDVEMTAEIQYGDNKVGKMKTSSLKELSNTVKIVGTKGTISVNRKTCACNNHSNNFNFIENMLLDSDILVSTDSHRC